MALGNASMTWKYITTNIPLYGTFGNKENDVL